MISFEWFDVMNSCLTVFNKRDSLRRSCVKAIIELGSVPFEGKLTCAALMGRAMEILRREFHADAPNGWVPILKRLRQEAHIEGVEQKTRSVTEFLERYFPSSTVESSPEPLPHLSEEEIQERRTEEIREFRNIPLLEGLVWDRLSLRIFSYRFEQPVLREILEAVNCERESSVPVHIVGTERWIARSKMVPRTFAQAKPWIKRAIELAKSRNVDSSVLEEILHEVECSVESNSGGVDAAECVLPNGSSTQNADCWRDAQRSGYHH